MRSSPGLMIRPFIDSIATSPEPGLKCAGPHGQESLPKDSEADIGQF